MEPTLYDVLGIDRDAFDVGLVKPAFKKAALHTHPDKLAPTASKEERANACALFDRVREAARVLSDPVLRSTYDAAILGSILAHVGRVSDVYRISDFEAHESHWSMECRCGGSYVVFAVPTQEHRVHAECDCCSLFVEVAA